MVMKRPASSSATIMRRPAAAEKDEADTLLMKKPAGVSEVIMKQPAGNDSEEEYEDGDPDIGDADADDGNIVMKKPADMSEVIMKRPAGNDSEEENAADGDADGDPVMKKPASVGEQEDEATTLLMKRPAGVGEEIMKRPAGDNLEGKDEPDGDAETTDADVMKRPASAGEQEEGEAPKREGNNVMVDARVAARLVRRQQTLIDKLNAEKENLAQKVKDNRSALTRAEKVMEGLKEEARKKSRAVSNIKAAKRKKILEAKAERAKVLGARATTAIKAAKRRLDAVSDSLKSIQDKREDAHSILKRAQKKYDDAVQECSELEAQGQHVPEDGEKDLSAPGAWKPPGIAASKARAVAKIALDRAREVYEKVAAIAKSREEKADVAKARIDAAKKLRKAAEESVKL